MSPLHSIRGAAGLHQSPITLACFASFKKKKPKKSNAPPAEESMEFLTKLSEPFHGSASRAPTGVTRRGCMCTDCQRENNKCTGQTWKCCVHVIKGCSSVTFYKSRMGDIKKADPDAEEQKEQDKPTLTRIYSITPALTRAERKLPSALLQNESHFLIGCHFQSIKFYPDVNFRSSALK